jgi:hypothetical protein
MTWFYLAVATAAVSAMLGFDRLADLALCAACVIGYLDSRIPRDISVTIIRPEQQVEAKNHDSQPNP